MRRGSKKKPVRVVIYDDEDQIIRRCSVCFEENGIMINPCSCSIKYHQICILRYIKEKLISMNKVLDMSKIKCNRCHNQFKFHYEEVTKWGCYPIQSYKPLILIVILFSIICTLVLIVLNLETLEGVYWALLITIMIIGFVLFLVIVYFLQKNLMRKQIILMRVYDYAQIMNNNSNSSDDSPSTQIYSQSFKIVINGAE